MLRGAFHPVASAGQITGRHKNMSKIKIISQAEQGVTIDISGCTNAEEARSYLGSTLQVSSQFWQGLAIDLTLGDLSLGREEAERMLAVLHEVGINPRFINSDNATTTRALKEIARPAPALNEPVISRAASAREAAGIADGFDKPCAAEAAEAAQAAVAVLTAPTATTAAQPEPSALQETPTGNPVTIPVPSLELVTAAPEAVASPAVETSLVSSAVTGTVTMATATKQPAERQPAVMLLKQTLRSGQAVSHSGHLVIIGDVNPGAELTADGDITVWGTLRGMAHAGAGGNTKAEVRALRFEAIQLRIANAIARAPDRTKLPERGAKIPETARIIDGKIRISAFDPE